MPCRVCNDTKKHALLTSVIVCPWCSGEDLGLPPPPQTPGPSATLSFTTGTPTIITGTPPYPFFIPTLPSLCKNGHTARPHFDTPRGATPGFLFFCNLCTSSNQSDRYQGIAPSCPLCKSPHHVEGVRYCEWDKWRCRNCHHPFICPIKPP